MGTTEQMKYNMDYRKVLAKKRKKREIEKERMQKGVTMKVQMYRIKSALVIIAMVVAIFVVANSSTQTMQKEVKTVVKESVNVEEKRESNENDSVLLPMAGITRYISEVIKKAECSSSAGISKEIFDMLATISKNETETVKASQEEEEVDLEIKGFPEYADEVYLLAQIIECEAGKTYEDRVYTGSVVINRARTNYDDFASVHTIKQVLYQGYYGGGSQQYETTTIKKVESGVQPSEDSLKVAEGLIAGEINCLEERVLFQTTHKPTSALGNNLIDCNLSNSCQYFGSPKDF